MKLKLFLFASILFLSRTLFAQQGTYTNNYGTFNDGSGVGINYSDNQRLYYTIYVPSVPGAKMTIRFTYFNTEADCDFVRIYQGPNEEHELILDASGSCTEVITREASWFYIEFITDWSETREGWEITYSYNGATSPPVWEPFNSNGLKTTKNVGIATQPIINLQLVAIFMLMVVG